jgi:hypothetical protein
VTLNSSSKVGARGETELDYGVSRLTGSKEAREFVDTSFDQVFFTEDGVVKIHVVGLRETTVGVPE